MKTQTKIRRLILSLSAVMIITFSNNARGQEACNGFAPRGAPIPPGMCNAATIGLIPPAFHANSSGFRVPNMGTLRVIVYLNTYTANVGSSRYRVSLRRGSPGTNAAFPSGVELAVGEIVVGSTSKELTLSTVLDDCGETGTYHVRISNVSTDNPQMGSASVFYGYPPLTTKELLMSSPLERLARSNETERSIGSIDKTGLMVVRGKWHVPALIPTYGLLSISLRRPDGSVAVGTKQYWSYHHPTGIPKFSISYKVRDEDARMSGQWKLAIKNGPDHEIQGFDIRKGSDPNPFVTAFKSTFTNGCGQ